jgi:hypothetical protein
LFDAGPVLKVAKGGTGIASFGTGIATFLGTPSSANLRAALTDETGTGSAVFATAPTIASANLTTALTLTGAAGNSGQVLTSGGSGVAPTWTTASGGSYDGFKNRIINGGMLIDQRNAGAAVTPTGGTYTLDRYFYQLSQASKATIQQNAGSVTPPTGFTNYLGVTSTSAYSSGVSDFFRIFQSIEGLNVSDLAWGTANAKTVTLSFWVRSSLTGTFGGSLQNSASNRSYPFTYTISSANTWEYETITIAGDTSGTWLTTNGTGIVVGFNLGTGTTFSGTANAWAGANYLSATGSTSVLATNGATFYITGVQLEKGSTATSFDMRPYGTELALCQRYLPAFTNGGSNGYLAPVFIYSSTGAIATIPFQVPTRVKPTGVTINNFDLMVDGTANFNVSAAVFNNSTPTSGSLTLTISGATGGHAGGLLCETSTNILFTGCEL